MSPQKVHISERGVSNVQASKSNKVHKKKTPSKRENSVIRGEMSTPKNDSTKINDSAVIREEVVSVTKLRADSIKKDQDARTEINDIKKSVLKKKYTNMCEKHTLDMKVGGKKYDNELLRSTLFKKQLKELENLEKQS
uniref:Uncharacterized protein n=1 Tax=Cacopsylla melanoneura TaxID=428564 RepID=A0A8D9ERA4_9HEMI